MTKLIYVKDLFEEKFIDKLLTFLHSEDLAIKTYSIDIKKIEKEATKNFYRLHGEYVSEYIKKDELVQDYFEKLAKENQIHKKYPFAYSGNDKYTFEMCLQQIYFPPRDLKAFFYNGQETELEDFKFDNSAISLNNFFEMSNPYFPEIANIKLPFEVTAEQEDKFSFTYSNKEQTFLKAYKIIIEEIFNYSLKELNEDIFYSGYLDWEDSEIMDILKIDAILQTVRERFFYFQQSFFASLEIFIQFAFTESLIFSAKSKFYYNKFPTLDKDRQKTGFYNEVVDKLIETKKSIYNKLSNLSNDRRGGTKFVKDKDFFTDAETFEIILTKNNNLQKKIYDLKIKYKINKYGIKINNKKLDNLKEFEKNEPDIYSRLVTAYEYLKNKDDARATNHRNIAEFIIQTSPEFLAYAILVQENGLDSTLETFKKKLSEAKS